MIVLKKDNQILKFKGNEILKNNMRMSVETANKLSFDDLKKYNLYKTIPFQPSKGKMISGEVRFEEREDKIYEVYDEIPLPPLPTTNDILNELLTSNLLLKSLILSLNDGSFIIGMNKSITELKEILLKNMDNE